MAPKTATGSFEKSGALFFSLIYLFLNALAETTATVNSRSVLLKQLMYGFIHLVAYVFAQTIADMPIAAFQTLVFLCMYYFMLGLALNASDFWIFVLFVFVHYGAVQAMFRMLGAWSPNLSIALLMAGSGMPVSLLYSGICPSPWALEGLMANEFVDITLECTQGQMVPSGSGWTYNNDPRTSSSSSRVFKKSATTSASTDSLSKLEKSVGSDGSPPPSSDSERESQSLEKPPSQSSALPNTFFTFEDLSYFVNGGGSEKQLLTSVNGYARPGQLTALMGASGAGKTTLLDTLAQRKSQGRVEGRILLNRHQLDRTFARWCGFVLQQDVHEPTATIREAFQFSARMRQPKDVPESEKLAYVEHVIRLLDLEMLAEAVIGETGDGLLSVEERKRVTIGVELAARPSALFFLDEPTSGLDSQAAYALKVFPCTIHQPSGVLFDMFDHILLLAPGGKTVFFGETGNNSANVVDYFDRYGAHIGKTDNPAEFILATVTDQKSSRDWVSTWNNSPEAQEVGKRITSLNSQSSNDTPQQNPDGTQFSLGHWEQTVEVTKRHWISVWRNGPYNFSRLFKSIFCQLFIAFSFFMAEPNTQGLQNHMLAILLLAWIIPATAADIQNIWFEKWDIFAAREKNGIYKWSALLTALIIVEIPWQICFYTIVFFCSYWTVGFPNTPILAGFQYFMFLLLGLFGTGYSQLLAALFANRTTASYANSLFWVILMLFSGVLVPHSAMNGFYKPWLFWVDPMRYFFGGSVSNILHNVKAQCSPGDFTIFDPPSGETCAHYASIFLQSSTGYLSNPEATSECWYCPYTTGDDYTATLDYYYADKWRDWAVFLAFCLTNVGCLYVIMWWRQGRSKR
ncbi:hypothetical protein N7465_009086 [Penicillium sp. CMV-2018d]|nr:hypothetical protein N7465_009086 [Penicillium sp. CMV-2018d]